MKNYATLFFLLTLSTYYSTKLDAQCNTSPCPFPMPSVDATQACVHDSPSALDCYYGSTTSEQPVSFPPSWCTVINNNQWFAFVADAPSASFEIACYGCAQGVGIQAAVLSTTDCVNFTFVSACLGNIGSGTQQTLVASPLTPGETYYLCIDGNAGAICDYSINATLPTVNGPADGMCIPSSATGTYTVTSPSVWEINPPSGGTFLGPNTGLSVNVQFLEPGPVEVCATSTQCPNAPTECILVNVGEDVTTFEEYDLCFGKTVQCAGQTFTQPGNFMVNLPSYLNCDSIVNCQINLIPQIITNIEVDMCQGQSATCAGEEFFNPGTYNVTFQNYQGCDSIVRCRVNLLPTYNSPFFLVNLCAPDTYEMCGVEYTESGLHTEICTNSQGCDSIVNVNLAILNPNAVIAPPAVIDCDSNAVITLNGSGSSVNTAVGGITTYFWTGPGIIGFPTQPTVQVNQPGEYCLVVSHARGGVYCSDTTCVTVEATSALPQMPTISGDTLPCGDSTILYVATSGGFPPPTSFVWTTPNNISYTSISEDSILISWTGGAAGGQLCVTANNSCGASQPACQPITVLQPIIPPAMSGPDTLCADAGLVPFTLDTVQPGVSYVWTVPAGAVLTGSNDSVFIDFAQSVSGAVCVTPQNSCGTLPSICRNVQVMPVPTVSLSGGGEICNGDSIVLNFGLTGNGPFDVTWSDGAQNFTLNDISNGHQITLSPTSNTTYHLIGVADNTTPGACTATSTDSVTATVWQHFSANLNAAICDGESILLGGALQTVSGVYTDSLLTLHGCDSVLITALTVHPIDTMVFDLTTCDPAMAGSTTQVLAQTNGCDSIVITNVALLPTDMTEIFDSSCDPNDVGVFVQNLSNQYGCDSTVVTTITYSESDTTLLFTGNCDPTQVGVFEQLLVAANGCDSLVITTVSLLPESTTQISGQSCNPSEVGVFTEVLSNQFGCDSTVVTTITQFYLDTTFLAATTCDPTQSGVFTQTLLTAQGCDSLIVTTVDLLPESTTQLSGQSCNPSEVGVFTEVLSNQYGCDSTVITTITQFYLDTTFLAATTCDPAQAGVFVTNLLTAQGCDSIVTTTVALLPSDDVAIFSTTCDPALAGVFTFNLTNQFGCDSIVTETVDLLPSDTTYLSFTTCDAAQVGTVTTVLSNQYGCDSTVVATTALLPPDNCSVDFSLAGSVIPCGSNTGSLTITPTLGLPPFTFDILLGGTTVASGTAGATGVAEVVSGLAPGNYTVNINSDNGFNTTAQATIVQLFPPDLSAAVVSDFAGFAVSCTGESDGSARATATGGLQPYQFAWSNGGVTAQIDNLGAGMYTVTVTDANACTNTATVSLSEPTPMVAGFTVRDIDCFGEQNGAIIAAVSGGAPPYRYALDGFIYQTSNAFTGLQAGSYTLNIADANDCEYSETVTVSTAPELTVELGDEQSIAIGESVTLQAIVSYPADSLQSIVWTPAMDSSGCPTCLVQVLTPAESQYYSIRVVSNAGCTAEDRVLVIVDRRKFVYVPNVFSPNDDGVNDKFGIFAKEGTVARVKTFQVFDRWGASVYENANFQPNDITIGWDGRVRGERQNPGVFVWMAEIEFIDGTTELYKGDVTLER